MTGVIDYAPDPTSRWSFFTLALGRSSPGTAITRVGVDADGSSRTDVVVPAGIAAGDHLIVHAAHEDSSYAMPATPAGWTLLGTENAAFSDACSSIFYRVADGTEDGTTVDFVDAVTGAFKKRRSLVVYRGASGISDWASADNGSGVDGPTVSAPGGATVVGFMCVWSTSYSPSPLTAQYVDTGQAMTVLWSGASSSSNAIFAVEIGLTPTPEPADETGWCLTTLNEFADNPFGTSPGLAADDDYLYVAYDDGVARVDFSDWSIDTTWATCDGPVAGLAITTGGDLIALIDNYPDETVSKITAAGSVTNAFGSLPTDWYWAYMCSMGADDLVYAAVFDDDDFGTVVSIDPATGTVTDIAGLHLANDDEWYGFATSDGDGVVWATLVPSSNETVNRLRSWDGSTATDHNIQDVPSPITETGGNAATGIYSGADGAVLVPMLTRQSGFHRYSSGGFFNNLWGPTGASSPSYTRTLVGCTYSYGDPNAGLGFQPNSGGSSYSAKLAPNDWPLLYRGSHVIASLRYSHPISPGGQTVTFSLVDLNTNTVLATSGPVTDEDDTALTWDGAVAPLFPRIGVLIAVALAAGTYAGNSTEIITFTVNLTFRQPAPDMAWFLRVEDGMPSRIAGTWDYTGSPAPDTSALSRFQNLEDGPLNTSMANSVGRDTANTGMSADRSTLYFLDDSKPLPYPDDGVVLARNLLRKLALCPVTGGFRLGVVAFS